MGIIRLSNMTITDIKKDQGYFETLINRLQKTEFKLQFCVDEEWEQAQHDFLCAFMDLRAAIEKEYGDSMPHLLGLKGEL